MPTELKYNCKECGQQNSANSMEQIIKWKKLCGACLSKQNQAKLKKIPLARRRIK